MKIQHLFLLVVLNYCLVNAQTINIPIITTDGVNPYRDTLRIGLDVTATDCIDSLLGEPTINPPNPPPGVFLSTFQLPSFCAPFLTTNRDFRNAPAFPFTGQKEHRMVWQLSIGSSSFTLFYNFPGDITANIKDIFGGTLFNQNLQDSGSYTIPEPYNGALLTVYYDNVLPVEFYSFTSSFNGTYVSLNWVTASETNNQGFEIERTSPSPSPYEGGGGEAGGGWYSIGFVEGHGTTTETNSYFFIDKDLQSGKFKYRLKQIDFDGSFNYSKEVEVDLTPKEFKLYQNYPNPFNPSTSIQYSIGSKQFVQLKVYDVLGNEIATLINEEKPAGSYQVEFDGSKFTSGIYYYELSTGVFTQTKKMTIVK